MFNGFRIVLCGALLWVTAAIDSAHAAQTSFYVGTCKPGKADFTTIQAAVVGVPPGSIVHVCPGTYPEQVTITRPLTLQGITSGNGASVIIAPPAGGILTATFPLLDGSTAQILVSNPGGPVDLSGFVVDGTGIPDGGAGSGLTESIAYNSASGVINRVAIKNMPPSNLASAGVSIGDDAGVSPSVTVENSSIDGSDTDSNHPYGIFAGSYGGTPSPGTINVTVSNNVFTSNAQGIEIDAGVEATISGNLISAVGSGIELGNGSQPLKITGNTLMVNRGIQIDGTTASLTITGNTFVSSETGIWLSDVPTATVSGNQLIGTYGAFTAVTGIDFRCSSITLTASGNTFISLSTALGSVVQDAAFPKAPGTYANVQNIETLCD